MIYQYIEELSKDKTVRYKTKLLLKKMIDRINDKFLDRVYEWFLDKMFGMESRRTREEFVKRLQSEDFNWMFNPQSVRDKIE